MGSPGGSSIDSRVGVVVVWFGPIPQSVRFGWLLVSSPGWATSGNTTTARVAEAGQEVRGNGPAVVG